MDEQIRKRCLLLYASFIKITDEKTGEIIEGLSLNYVSTQNLSPTVKDNNHGYRPAKAWVDESLYRKIVKAPGFYDITLEMSADSKGKATISVVDLDFVSEVSLTAVAPKDTAKDPKDAKDAKDAKSA